MDDDYHFKPETYLDWARRDIPGYDQLQEEVARAAGEVDARRILDLGTGTGETALRVLARQREAKLVGLDVNPEMLAEAHASLPASQVETLVSQSLQDPLPAGPFDLVFSSLAVHHLDAEEKRSLFARIAEVLAPGGRFVLGDVVVPDRPEDAEVPVSEGYDKPDTVEDQLGWLAAAGFVPRVTWASKDLTVLVADLA